MIDFFMNVFNRIVLNRQAGSLVPDDLVMKLLDVAVDAGNVFQLYRAASNLNMHQTVEADAE